MIANSHDITRTPGVMQKSRLSGWLEGWASKPKPCSFLALPAELRVQIYEACLAPTGTLYLTSSATHHRAVEPKISPALLATCRQIRAEAEEVLYRTNSICIVTSARAKHQPILTESRLPQSVLRKLARFCVILDYTLAKKTPFTASEFDVFTAMTSLVEVHFAVIFRDECESVSSYMRSTLPDLLYLIRVRLPAQVRIQFGVEAGSSEEAIVEDLLQEREAILRREQRPPFSTQLPHQEQQPLVVSNMASLELVEMVSDGMARMSAASPSLQPGLLSGSIPDVYILNRHNVDVHEQEAHPTQQQRKYARVSVLKLPGPRISRG